MRTVVDDGHIMLNEQGMKDKCNKIGQDLDIPKAVGVSFASFIGGPLPSLGGSASSSSGEYRVVQDAVSPSSQKPPLAAANESKPMNDSTASASNHFGFSHCLAAGSSPSGRTDAAPLGDDVGPRGKGVRKQTKRGASAGVRASGPAQGSTNTASLSVSVPPNMRVAAGGSGGVPRAAGGAAGNARPPAGGGGRGRKADDAFKIGKQQLKGFEDSEENDDNFYGSHTKQHKAYLKRVKDKLEVLSSSEQDPIDMKRTVVCYKAFLSMTEIHNSFLLHGFHSKLFVAVVDHKLEFCKMAPVVHRVPMPKLMKRAHN